jgi:hypothetical protein
VEVVAQTNKYSPRHRQISDWIREEREYLTEHKDDFKPTKWVFPELKVMDLEDGKIKCNSCLGAKCPGMRRRRRSLDNTTAFSDEESDWDHIEVLGELSPWRLRRYPTPEVQFD